MQREVRTMRRPRASSLGGIQRPSFVQKIWLITKKRSSEILGDEIEKVLGTKYIVTFLVNDLKRSSEILGGESYIFFFGKIAKFNLSKNVDFLPEINYGFVQPRASKNLVWSRASKNICTPLNGSMTNYN